MVVPNDPRCYGAGELFLSDVVDNLYGYSVTKDLTTLCQYLSDMDKRGVDGVVMGCYKDTEVQFIVYRDDMSQKEVTEDMDFNVCQITMDSSGNRRTTHAYDSAFKDRELRIMHSYSEKRKEKRMERMLAKYPDFTPIYNWK